MRRFESRVFDLCRRYLGSLQDAEEVSQDVFLKVFHSIGQFQGRSAFRTWLFRIASNECATRYRKLKRRTEALTSFAQAECDERSTLEMPGVFSDPLDLVGPIGDAWRTISESDRMVLGLRHVAHLPIAEVADALELGLSAAKMRLYRAEARLRLAYDKTGRM